jgi:serine/threonine-protein kinase
VTAAAGLRPPGPCIDPHHLEGKIALPDDPATREAVTAQIEALNRAEALQAAGAHERGLELAHEVLAEASQLGYAPLEAEALLLVGALEDDGGDYAAAEKNLEAAFHLAGRIGYDSLAEQAATRLVSTVGNELARHGEGLRWGKHAELLHLRFGNADPIRAAELQLNLGVVHAARGSYDQAVEHYERALEVRQQVLGPNHPNVAPTVSQLGNVQFSRGRYGEAIARWQQAVEIVQQALGADHPQASAALANIGVAYQVIGDYPKALEYQHRNLAILQGRFGPDHPDVAAALQNLGNIHYSKKSFDEAAKNFEAALAIWRDKLGPEHPNVAVGLNNLGAVYAAREAWDQAIAHHQEALTIRQTALGADHPDVSTSLTNLAQVYGEQGEHDKAVDYHQRALTARRRNLGPSHPDVAYSLFSLGTAQQARGHHGLAIRHFEAALSMREQLEVAPHLMAQNQFALARSLVAAGKDHPRAQELATLARTAYREAGAPSGDDLAEVEAWLARRGRGRLALGSAR